MLPFQKVNKVVWWRGSARW